MKKKLIVFFAAMLVFSGIASAEGNFMEICKTLSEHNVTKGDFSQIRYVKKMKKEFSAEGTFIISVADGMFWDTKKPFASKIAFTKNSVIQIAKNGKKSVIKGKNNASFEEFSTVFSSLFDGNYENIEKNFDIDFSGNINSWKVVLTPKAEILKKTIATIELGGDTLIKNLTTNEVSGDFSKYTFSNHIFAETLSADEKAFFVAD